METEEEVEADRRAVGRCGRSAFRRRIGVTLDHRAGWIGQCSDGVEIVLVIVVFGLGLAADGEHEDGLVDVVGVDVFADEGWGVGRDAIVFGDFLLAVGDIEGRGGDRGGDVAGDAAAGRATRYAG